MTRKIHVLRPASRPHNSPLAEVTERFRLRRALASVARAVGKGMEQERQAVWEGQSLGGSHVWSRNDLIATGRFVHQVAEVFGREKLEIPFSIENEEVPLLPPAPAGQWYLRLIIDPIDGSKAFDNFKSGGDVPLPRPSSAVSVAAVDPALGEIVATALYLFDLEETFSSVLLQTSPTQYLSFRQESLLDPLTSGPTNRIEARRRVLNGNYNSRALAELARLELALMDRGLKGAFGGLTGSSATDIVNVVRGSFIAALDVRALTRQGGSVPYWYDVAGALPIAQGRGLRVIAADAQGVPLIGGDHAIYTPVVFVVAAPDVAETVFDAIRSTVWPDFLRPGTAEQPAA